jgi:hypothetical protein
MAPLIWSWTAGRRPSDQLMSKLAHTSRYWRPAAGPASLIQDRPGLRETGQASAGPARPQASAAPGSFTAAVRPLPPIAVRAVAAISRTPTPIARSSTSKAD